MISDNLIKKIKNEINGLTPSDWKSYDRIQQLYQTIVDDMWKNAKADPAKASALKHYVPQFHIKGFSSSNEFAVVNPKTLIKKRGSQGKNYAEMAFEQSEAQYSLKMEAFLGDMEALGSNLIYDSGVSRTNLRVDDLQKLADTFSMTPYSKIMFSAFLASQWFRTRHALQGLQARQPGKSIDDIILDGISYGAPHFLAKRWLFLESSSERLWLPPHPIFLYPRKIVGTPGSSNPKEVFIPGETQDIGKFLIAPSVFNVGMFPITKHMMLYMSNVGTTNHIWLEGLHPEDRVGYTDDRFESDRRDGFLIDQPQGRFKVFFSRDTGSILASVPSVPQALIPVAKTEATVSIELSKVVFSEYNAVAALEQDFIYVDKTDFENKEAYLLDKPFRASELVSDLLKVHLEKNMIEKIATDQDWLKQATKDRMKLAYSQYAASQDCKAKNPVSCKYHRAKLRSLLRDITS